MDVIESQLSCLKQQVKELEWRKAALIEEENLQFVENIKAQYGNFLFYICVQAEPFKKYYASFTRKCGCFSTREKAEQYAINYETNNHRYSSTVCVQEVDRFSIEDLKDLDHEVYCRGFK